MKNKRQSWMVGDVFLVPLRDNSCGVGQVIAREPSMLNSVSCAFFKQRVIKSGKINLRNLTIDSVISVLFTTHDLLDSGVWRVVSNQSICISLHFFPYEHTRANGWIGAIMYGSGNVREFLDAFHKLRAWDDWADPNYLEKLLFVPGKRPRALHYKSRKATQAARERRSQPKKAKK